VDALPGTKQFTNYGVEYMLNDLNKGVTAHGTLTGFRMLPATCANVELLFLPLHVYDTSFEYVVSWSARHACAHVYMCAHLE
jgi:hypothetical protein